MSVLRGLVTARVIGTRIRAFLLLGNGRRARVCRGLGKRGVRGALIFVAALFMWPLSAVAPMLALIAMTFVPSNASATEVHFNFSGTVTNARAQGAGVSVPGGIAAGDVVTGHFSYDTEDATNTGINPPFISFYTFSPAQPVNKIEITISGLTWSSTDDYAVLVTNDDATFSDRFNVTLEAGGGGGTPSLTFPGSLGQNRETGFISISDTIAPFDLLTSTALPTSSADFNLAAAQLRGGQLLSVGVGDPNAGGEIWSISFDIDTLTVALESLVLYDDFNAGFIDFSNRWFVQQPGNDIVREVQSGRLHMFNRGFGGTSSNTGTNFDGTFLNFQNANFVTAIKATLEVDAVAATSCPLNPDPGGARASLFGDFFNIATPTPGSHLDDVRASIRVVRLPFDPLNVLRVEVLVIHCTNANCSGGNVLDFRELGNVNTGQQVTLRMEWDPDNDRFIFQRDSEPLVFSSYFVPDTIPPGAKLKGLLVSTFPPNCTTAPQPMASMDAFFDDVFVNPNVEIFVGDDYRAFREEHVLEPFVTKGIGATFTPQFGRSLDEVAAAAGFDHLNWKNVVLSAPWLDDPSIDEEVKDAVRDINNELPTVPFEDPVPGGIQGQAEKFGRPLPVRDDRPWYLDEVFTDDGIEVTEFNMLTTMLDFTTRDTDNDGMNDTLLFSDRPRFPGNSTTTFRTYLVGVNEDGTGDILDIPGTSFLWNVLGTGDVTDVIILDNFIGTPDPTGFAEFGGFVPPNNFSAAELQLFADLGIGISTGSFVISVVKLDIKPGDNPNSINPRTRGKIPVAILSTADFDAPFDVDDTSLTFGRTGQEDSLVFCRGAEDVNSDGLLDLLCHFDTQATGFQEEDTGGILKGETFDGIPIVGGDSVSILQ